MPRSNAEYFALRYAGMPAVVFGFHGCSRDVAAKVLHEGESLKDSNNDYDWLGHGKYFWEANPVRALEWAREHCKRYGGEPAVVGACIDLSNCLNLISSAGLRELKEAYEVYAAAVEEGHVAKAINDMSKNSFDMFNRRLDCNVVMTAHASRERKGLPAYTSVRGVFWEGEDLYANAGFKEKNHIQICVTDSRAILCYFHPQCYLDQNLGQVSQS